MGLLWEVAAIYSKGKQQKKGESQEPFLLLGGS